MNSPRWLSKDDLEGEEWRDVVGYEGLYMVSDYGRVKALERTHPSVRGGYYTRKEKIMKVYDNGNGYLYTRFSLNGVTHFSVHRLVAMTFIENNECYNEINHKDENKGNNCVYNLEWCSRIYNANYGTRKERERLTKIKNDSDRKTIETRNRLGLYGAEKPVVCFSVSGVMVAQYRSVSTASRETGINIGHICECCKGTRNIAGNLIWKYANKV